MADLPLCSYIRKEEIDGALASVATPGKRLLEPLKSRALSEKLPINILEDQAVSNEVEVHRYEGDLWHCLEGEVTFVYGGRLVDAEMRMRADGITNEMEIKALSITNGTEVVLKPGDWLWIPAGQPHLHRTEGTARLVIIKIPTREVVPLEAVPGWK